MLVVLSLGLLGARLGLISVEGAHVDLFTIVVNESLLLIGLLWTYFLWAGFLLGKYFGVMIEQSRS